MSIRLSNIRLSVDEPELELPGAPPAALDVRPADIERWRDLRKSLDARDKSRIAFVYAVEVSLAADERQLVARAARAAR